MNSNVGRREGSGPQLQVARRSSLRPSSGISRLLSANPAQSTSAPDVSHLPVVKSYGTVTAPRRPPKTISDALDLAGVATAPSASRRSAPRLLHSPFSSPAAVRSSFLVHPAPPAKFGITLAPLPKPQRTTKTSQKLVVLPSAPQTKPLAQQLVLLDEEQETSDDASHPQYKSAAERMTKDERKKAGYKRITAYCIAEGFKMKVLAGFLKREHNAQPRVFDEAVYALYHLPLLPGYGPQTNVRSSTAPEPTKTVHTMLPILEEVEEPHYHFDQPTTTGPTTHPAPTDRDPEDYGYVTSGSLPTDHPLPLPTQSTTSPSTSWTPQYNNYPSSSRELENVAEAVFFDYGVVVFFGFDERGERDVLEDIERAGAVRRRIGEDEWEIEECHFTHDTQISYPRIYNDFFTLKSRSHLLKLSIAHALAQSTLLARYETLAQRTLSSPLATSIPRQMALSGSLQLRRHEALKLTGRLFKLRRDVNLVSNVLDVPELFWSEASLKDLYDAVREYFEIGPRVESLNEKIGVASDFLDAIHDHLNDNAMERITRIIIWLIVVAILVELGEIIARLVVHSTLEGRATTGVGILSAFLRVFTASRDDGSSAVGSAGVGGSASAAGSLASSVPLSKSEVLETLERMMSNPYGL
ncbi:DUF155-domain-containing protein [Coprinopsis marcescibilis]|uniref:DUF155-domain-containing protein n=1 Tax=Coprinopsis marcescibilis TaxID=230819 RepID=A0A5C3KLB2_COPMA|nr:DUF155-domain-containing protein [Coprinopsis marcescibilis]